MARTWNRIAHAIDGDFDRLAQCLVWMPSQQAFESTVTLRKSNGKAVTPWEWRANAMADKIAKAARGDRLGADSARRRLLNDYAANTTPSTAMGPSGWRRAAGSGPRQGLRGAGCASGRPHVGLGPVRCDLKGDIGHWARGSVGQLLLEEGQINIERLELGDQRANQLCRRISAERLLHHSLPL